LYYRLSSMQIQIPSLAERPEDIPFAGAVILEEV
jgi:DNA-binding NtrC family response regulator